MSLNLIGLIIRNVSGGELTSPGEIQWPFDDISGNPSVNSDGRLKNNTTINLYDTNDRVILAESVELKKLINNGDVIGIASDGVTVLSTEQTLAKVILPTINEVEVVVSSSVVSARLASSRDVNISADGKQGKLDPNGLSGWNFQNEFVGEKNKLVLCL